MAEDPLKKLKQIKTGAFSRGFAIAKLSAQATAKMAGHAVGGIFADESEKGSRAMALLLSQVELLTKELGQLKGSLMKAGQMLSVYGENLLPPEINQVLKSLQAQSPALDWAPIEKSLRAELGERFDELEIDREPHASASLGQVHRAVIRAPGPDQGQSIALKVQYPGVDLAIESDIRALKRVFGLLKMLPQGPRYDQLFEEVREMLHQEVDYAQELRLTELYREKVGVDPRYVVPRTFARYCTGKVMATSFEVGVGVDSPEVLGLSQERRNAIGLAVLELYLRELFEFRLVQTDPHFGNFRIRLRTDESAPDQIVLLDFGATRVVPEAFLPGYRRMVRGAFYEKQAEVEAGAIEMGFLRPGDSPEMKRCFYEFCALITEPWMLAADGKERPYDFSVTDLPRRVVKKGADLARMLGLRPPPRELVFIDRKVGGVFVFLSTLKAKFAARDLLSRYLD